MKYGLIILVLLSSSAFANNELSVCESHQSKYEKQSCLNQLIEEKKRDLRVITAEVNAIVVSQEETGISRGLGKEFSLNTENFKTYLNSHCSLYLGAIGANMGTGSVVASMECEYVMLEQRIKALSFIKR
ncbi:ribose-5-phosphate isomerase [Pseudoalteromonas arctica]|uniref:Ribose-5-phosphate isomerase n=1 Tax=Pseudoalteromonas arctica TaxID=394751 RepID=A0AAP6Y6R6_9GAMM|nr:ribose-5-phosphate isomerase [Pseudoalteromonas arctica]NMP03673.1 ribose-5-phosphate isomerase [Pseudoalteromonas arctica]